VQISKLTVINFRILKSTMLDLKKDISLLIGKNNTGKTSFLVLLEKFFNNKPFYYSDFPLSLRDDLRNINNDTDDSKIDDLAIKLIVEIQYDEEDDLVLLSDFMLDLDPDKREVSILFERRIDLKALLQKTEGMDDGKKKSYIEKNIQRWLKTEIYTFDENGSKPIDLKLVKNLINLEIIHARRNVASSEDDGNKKPLGQLTTTYFKGKNDSDLPDAEIDTINSLVEGMDAELQDQYAPVFNGFLQNAKEFLDLQDLKVSSNIQAQALFENSSQVVYGDAKDSLPEHLNGLGYMNILHLLMTIEMKKDNFSRKARSINLLFIEEPEAHTHPQMQYVFAKKIKSILSEVDNLQTLITSHSAHIVSHSDFEDIRYLKEVAGNVEIKNFHTELRKKYSSEPAHFKFLEQYLNIQSAELFFASKVIFMEGITERMLLPLFIKQLDAENKDVSGYDALASQNISILEVGANAKVFAPFLDFLGIKTLVITDIDTTEKKELSTTKKNGATTIYIACSVKDGKYTSNATLRYFLESPELSDVEFNDWFSDLKGNKLKSKFDDIKLAYQLDENGYHARSFEDAFISLNVENIKAKKDELWGLKNKSKLDDCSDMYELTKSVIDKKSDFSASLLYLSLSEGNGVQWQIPGYIEEGLKWIAKS